MKQMERPEAGVWAPAEHDLEEVSGEVYSHQVYRKHAALTLAHLRCLAPRLAFICFHPANWIFVFFRLNLRIVLISLSVNSSHEFHISNQTNPKTCGWRNICPRSPQRLTYGHTPDQTYATKHIVSSLSTVWLTFEKTAWTHPVKLSVGT